MQTIDSEIAELKDCPTKEDFIIEKHKNFILSCAYKHTKRYITDSDDEYSISLSAFSDAIQSYEPEKGGFFAFAEKLIKRRLIDYYRSQKKYHREMQVNPRMFDTEPDEDEDNIALKTAIAEKVSYKTDYSLKYEIEAANAVFSSFGFRFIDLADCSPKAKKTKNSCTKAVKYILENKEIKEDIYIRINKFR